MAVDDKKAGKLVRVDTVKGGFFWFLMIIGAVLIVFFTLNMIINFIYGADLAGKGVSVVIKDAVYEDGTQVSKAEVAVLHGVSGWVAVFGPWMAVNANYIVLGAIFFAIGYVMTAKDEDKLPVSIFKARMLGAYLALVSIFLFTLGIDRIFFISHEARVGTLSWIDWYIFEFMAYVVWAAILGIMAVFLVKLGAKSSRRTEVANAE
ncbi:MAG: hypothetical protein SWK76_16180 [Actinomycetota bacterium]|nr:hypothetical protein [Actinomycetota bacterium]